ncbi:UNKNOWN [Stylonychia lemnae]|uniref:Uncharacterized protein n=1 Tax=Stylonychia lemnae TaxID=5949 RepID=A0A078AW28_STYLE|nr:UNKNOWN [Stylonychia lemnae]|eukprot:CDW84988.1 UNKNOWN [Stylonychia lemnae]
MKYYPILFEIGQEKIRQSYDGCKYLLQIWNQSQQKIFELHLNFHISFCNESLFAASKSLIQIVHIPQKSFQFENRTIQIKKDSVLTINPELKIHGLLLDKQSSEKGETIVVFETLDNQLDFNRIQLLNLNEQDDSFPEKSYKFLQCGEIKPRSNFTFDPIKKVCMIFSKDILYAVSLRNSGQIDLYWNMIRKSSENNKPFIDVSMSLNEFYFQSDHNSYLKLAHKNKSDITLQEAISNSDENFTMDQIHTKITQNVNKIFSGFQYLTHNSRNVCILTHGKFLSVFDILDDKWVSHIQFNDEIRAIFRLNSQDDFLPAVLLKNGSIYQKVLVRFFEQQEEIPENERDFYLEGSIIRIQIDQENFEAVYFTILKDDIHQLKVLWNDTIYDFEVVDPKENLNVVQLQATVQDAQTLIVVQNGFSFIVYEQIYPEGKLSWNLIYKYREFPEVTGILFTGNAYKISEDFFSFDNKNLYVFKRGSPDEIKVYKNIYCTGHIGINSLFNYVTCQQTSDSECQGLRFFNRERLVKEDKLDMILIKQIDIGALGTLEINYNSSRIGLMKSVTDVIVIPVLNFLPIRFIGSKESSEYTLFKQLEDKQIGLQKDGLLVSWNTVNGKPFREILLENHNYTDYE